MRTKFTAALIFALLAFALFHGVQPTMAQQQSSVRCLLTDPELQKRRNEIVDLLGGKIGLVTELPDGYRLQFKPADAALLVEFIQFERACCPFMTYTLTFEPENGPLSFSMTGPEGSKTFLKPLLDFLD